MMTATSDRRLIEDYLPLDALNAIASREKLHPRRYVELVHYWPARRPITASRTAVYAALVSAPNSDDERQDAASFVTRLAAYEPDPRVVGEAREHVRRTHGGRAPKVLDLFAGGGAIPLEAARLGCESHALDYNPVAHLIELCTLVFPQTFRPGLANDFQQWSEVVLDRLRREIGDLYPTIEIPRTRDVSHQLQLFAGGDPPTARQAEPVTYIWARTVPCHRPGCAASVPLVRQAWLRKKGGAVAAVPRIKGGGRLRWDIVSGSSTGEVSLHTKQTGAGQAVCVACNTPASTEHVKEMATAGRMRESLAAVVGALPPKRPRSKKRRKLFLSPASTQPPDEGACLRRLDALLDETSIGPLDEEMNTADTTTVAGRGYGISLWRELFTARQLLVLFTLIKHIRQAHGEMRSEGMAEDRARALATYFAMAFGRFVIAFNKFTRWEPVVQRTIGTVAPGKIIELFRLGEGDSAKPGIETGKVVAGFFSFFGFPRLLSGDVVRKAIVRGVETGLFAYTTGRPELGDNGRYRLDWNRIAFERVVADDEIDLDSGFLIVPSALPAKPRTTTDHSERVEDDTGDYSGTTGEGEVREDNSADDEQPPVSGGPHDLTVSFVADRDNLYAAWSALANLADIAGKVSVNVTATSEAGLDKAKLENGVLEPLRELGLIDD